MQRGYSLQRRHRAGTVLGEPKPLSDAFTRPTQPPLGPPVEEAVEVAVASDATESVVCTTDDLTRPGGRVARRAGSVAGSLASDA